MARRRRWTRALAVLALGAGLMAVPASAAESEQFPGLPEAAGVQYTGALINALGGSATAKQFFLIPTAVSAIDVSVSVAPPTPEVVAAFNAMPGPPPCELRPNGGVLSTVSRVYPLSPPGSPHAYGAFAPVTVRTVAFGSVPSEAVVSIELARDDADLPIPLLARQADANCVGPLGRRYTDASVGGAVTVSLKEVAVDGVDLQLDGVCRAEGALKFVGTGFRSGDQTVDRGTVYVAVTGGFLKGTLDLSDFTGCTTSAGEDLSPLVSGLLSGADNPVEARQGSIGPCFPSGDASGCSAPEDFDLADAPEF